MEYKFSNDTTGENKEQYKKTYDVDLLMVGGIGAIKFGSTLDAVTILIDESENYLLELTGERASEAVVNEVFSHFCVGK